MRYQPPKVYGVAGRISLVTLVAGPGARGARPRPSHPLAALPPVDRLGALFKRYCWLLASTWKFWGCLSEKFIGCRAREGTDLEELMLQKIHLEVLMMMRCRQRQNMSGGGWTERSAQHATPGNEAKQLTDLPSRSPGLGMSGLCHWYESDAAPSDFVVPVLRIVVGVRLGAPP